jgi:chromosome segregation ATPase
MRVPTISYELVVAKINELKQQGEKITVQNVIARSGGTTAKVAEYIRRWYKEQSVIEEQPLSQELLVAIAKEKQAAIEQVTKLKDQEIKSLEALLHELEELTKQSDVKLSELDIVKQQLVANQEKSALLEKSLTDERLAKDKLIEEQAALKNKLAEQQDIAYKLDTVTKEKLQAEKDVIMWKTKAEQLQEQLNTMLSKFAIK